MVKETGVYFVRRKGIKENIYLKLNEVENVKSSRGILVACLMHDVLIEFIIILPSLSFTRCHSVGNVLFPLTHRGSRVLIPRHQHSSSKLGACLITLVSTNFSDAFKTTTSKICNLDRRRLQKGKDRNEQRETNERDL